MATFRKRQLKNGAVYDIQVKLKDPVTNKTVVKTTVWHPEHKMTDRQAERECAIVAQKFEADIKKLYTGSITDIPDYNITVKQLGERWLERVKRDYSIAYYETALRDIAWINRYIGRYRIREVTPLIIQKFFDDLDEETYTTYTVIPKPELVREAMSEKGLRFKTLGKQLNNSCSLCNTLQGKRISLEFAKSLSATLDKKPEALFDIEKCVHLYSGDTIASVKKATRCVFAMAKRQRLIEDNFASADYISFGRKPKRNIAYLDDEQAKKLFAAAMDFDDIRGKTAILTALLTGMRRGEIAGLEWKDVDFEKNTISVNRTGNYSKTAGIYTKEPKTQGSVRRITVSEVLITVLKEYKEWYDLQKGNWGDRWVDSDRVFVQEYGKPINPSTIAFWLKKILANANLPHVTLHSLRHTNITLQIAAGVPLVTVAGRAGHSRPSTTVNNKYGHTKNKLRIKAA